MNAAWTAHPCPVIATRSVNAISPQIASKLRAFGTQGYREIPSLRSFGPKTVSTCLSPYEGHSQGCTPTLIAPQTEPCCANVSTHPARAPCSFPSLATLSLHLYRSCYTPTADAKALTGSSSACTTHGAHTVCSEWARRASAERPDRSRRTCSGLCAR